MPYELVYPIQGLYGDVNCDLKDGVLSEEFKNNGFSLRLYLKNRIKLGDKIEIKNINTIYLNKKEGVTASKTLAIDVSIFMAIAEKYKIYANAFYVLIDEVLETQSLLESQVIFLNEIFVFRLYTDGFNTNIFYFGNVQGLEFSLPSEIFLDI